MDAIVKEYSTGSIDIDLLAAVIHELNIARRNVSSYPKGHPVVSSSCERVVELFERLFAYSDAITIGVTRDTLLLGSDSLERLTPGAKGVARILSYHGIALITFSIGLAAEEVERFCGILICKRSDVAAGGGLEELVREAGIEHLQIRMVRYDAFQVSDGSCGDEPRDAGSASLWESFVRGLMREGLASPRGDDRSVAPEELAEILNSRSDEVSDLIAESLESSIWERSGPEALSSAERESLRMIGTFVGSLNPKLRKRLIDGVFNWQEEASLEIVSHLPRELLPEVFSYVRENQAVLSPLAVSVVERLAGGPLSMQGIETPTDRGISPFDETSEEEFEATFREETDEEYVPKEYLETLKELVTSRELPAPGRDELAELKNTLSSDRVEASVSGIILASLGMVTPERLEALKRSLLEISRYFLEVGDFRALEDMYVRLRDLRLEAGHAAASLQGEVIGAFETKDFVTEVMNGLDVWGKEKYREIGSLMHVVGRPFINPLLDRLAQEENRTLRRWCLDQLLKMGDLAKEAVLARLGDRRWYFVRNLVIILQHTWQPDVPDVLAGLAGFPHPKVRQAVIGALLRFYDPEGDRLLLHDLSSNDGETRMQAIRHAGKSRDPRIRESLLIILRKKGLSPERFAEKKAAIHSLARIGSGDILPSLEKQLTTRFFIRPTLNYMLKKEIVLNLGKYGEPGVALLRKTAGSSNRGLSGLAAELLEILEGKDG